MKKYIIANRRARKFTEKEKTVSRESLDKAFNTFEGNVNVIHDRRPEDISLRRTVVFEADPVEMSARAREAPPDVLLEPEILHWPDILLPAPISAMQRVSAMKRIVAMQRASAMQGTAVAQPFTAGLGLDFQVDVKGGGQPLEHVDVILLLEAWLLFQDSLAGKTDENGQIGFSYYWFFTPTGLVAIPYANFWRPWIEEPGSPCTVDCPPLPADGPLGWWHEVLGMRDENERGNGIRVGVVDSGCGPHAALSHVTDIGAFIDGDYVPNGGADSGSHGSHVCGTIAAKPKADGQYRGIASGAELFSARVFPPDEGANQGDIANAIDALSKDHRVDLINMSLGASTGSEIEHDAIQDALERGTLCVCAAGNDGTDAVSYPAAFPETIAVAALGREGEAPPETLSGRRSPEESDKRSGPLYLASFSSYGKEIDCIAPGVGIIATVPERYGLEAPYAPMDGTSMASPAACGALADILSQDGAFQGMPRDLTRAEMARALLHRHCRDIGLAREYQGYGVPDAG